MTSVGERVSWRKTKSGNADATLCFREFETSSTEHIKHRRSGDLTKRAWPIENLNSSTTSSHGRSATGVAHKSKTSKNLGATYCRPTFVGDESHVSTTRFTLPSFRVMVVVPCTSTLGDHCTGCVPLASHLNSLSDAERTSRRASS